MEMLFLNKGTSHYIDAKVGTVHNIDAMGEKYHIHMVENNQIVHLLKPVILHIDGVVWLRHNTERFYVFERFLSQIDMNGEMFRQIMKQIFECIRSMDEYLLNPDNLVIHTDYMFWDAYKQEMKMIYLPGRKQDIRIQLKEFLERIMKQFDHGDKQGLELMYGSYGMVVDENMDVRQLEQMICGRILGEDRKIEDYWDKESETDSYSCENSSMISASVSSGEDDDLQEFDQSSQRGMVGRVIAAIVFGVAAAWFFLDYLFFQGNKTNVFFSGVCLAIVVFLIMVKHEEEEFRGSSEQKGMERFEGSFEKKRMDGFEKKETDEPEKKIDNKGADFNEFQMLSLVPLSNGALEPMKIESGALPVSIGRGKKETTYQLKEDQISRIHASVCMKGNSLYIKDCFSTNGTFVNAIRIEPGVEYQVKKGDIVAFANEDFYVS